MRRLVLFDVDGTLVRGGPAKDAFHVAILEAFGTAGAIEEHDFSGKTDPQIARELLSDAGLDDARIDAGLPALWTRYLEELERRLPEHPMEVLAGVHGVVERLARHPAVAVGLVTGNIVEGARLKLGSAGVDLPVDVGGFGSDHELRNELPRIAMERAERRWGVPFGPEAVVIVGDTPRDVDCGRHCRTRTLAVATGRFSATELEEAGADHVVPDLRDTDRVVGLLLDGA